MEDIETFLGQLREGARQRYIPVVRDKTAHILFDICKDKSNILEIGTAIGYSGIIMLLSSKDSNLVTIEKDNERFLEAKQNFDRLNFSSRVNFINGDALVELEKLVENNAKFDLIFLDGPKGQYYKYLPLIKRLLTGGGVLFADNVLLGGLVEDNSNVTHKNRSMVVNMRKFIDLIEKDNSFLVKKFDIDDGFIIATMKKMTE